MDGFRFLNFQKMLFILNIPKLKKYQNKIMIILYFLCVLIKMANFLKFTSDKT